MSVSYRIALWGRFGDAIASFIRDFQIQRRDSNDNVALKVNSRSFSLYRDNSYLLSRLYANPPTFESKRPYSSSESEITFRRCLFTFSVKQEIRHFHAVVVQNRERNVKKREARAKSLFS